MKLRYRYILVILMMIVIFLFSSEPAEVSSARSGFVVDTIRSLNIALPPDIFMFLVRKSAHIFLYALFGFVVFNLVSMYATTKKAIVLSVLFVVVYAVSDEIHQLFIPGRSGEIRDVFIDTAAGMIGTMLYYMIVKKKNTPRP